jgi:hypothetical protein
VEGIPLEPSSTLSIPFVAPNYPPALEEEPMPIKNVHGGCLVGRVKLLPIFFFVLVYFLDCVLLVLVEV